eukprot:CAMPEP_0195523912 /NCGR_PEP_ID=MMETSP0794_2-20130614/23410_1 /TAXON_ID=515487 /ORGANISM="Stephanopyxis turris, Strain CCMP 815" /LENGTH=482 /DNA_ID=CAMNT_0040654017 /DNA_START=118 /DNA_END=1566 /DNA_ORIENTATION=+
MTVLSRLLFLAFTPYKCTSYLASRLPPLIGSNSRSVIFTTKQTTGRRLFASVTPPEERAAGRTLPDYGKTTVEVDTIRLSKIKKYRRKDLDGNSLVDQTLSELKTDVEFQETAKMLKTIGAKRMNLEEKKKRRRVLDNLGVPGFNEFVQQKYDAEQQQHTSSVDDDAVSGSYKPAIKREATKVLQLNIGLYCNQACSHCHVESSPKRMEMMSDETASKCLEILKNSPEITTLDITGGAPELNSAFRFLVQMARAIRPDLDIIDRCNLTVLHEPGQADLVDFLKEQRVHVIASLPCYSSKNVNMQRGQGVFDRSVSALLMLNEAGYGNPDTHPELQLDLVYNPLGAFLPPPQDKLEEQYKIRLDDDFGISFNQLYTMTNMPIKRFADFLYRRGELEEYMNLLVQNFNLDTLSSLMCTNTISVGYDGKIYDCDFNQQLGLGTGVSTVHEGGKTVFDITKLSDLKSDKIRTDNHCFGCTAGMGSS